MSKNSERANGRDREGFLGRYLLVGSARFKRVRYVSICATVQ